MAEASYTFLTFATDTDVIAPDINPITQHTAAENFKYAIDDYLLTNRDNTMLTDYFGNKSAVVSSQLTDPISGRGLFVWVETQTYVSEGQSSPVLDSQYEILISESIVYPDDYNKRPDIVKGLGYVYFPNSGRVLRHVTEDSTELIAGNWRDRRFGLYTLKLLNGLNAVKEAVNVSANNELETRMGTNDTPVPPQEIEKLLELVRNAKVKPYPPVSQD